jgi:hypothetical protein
VKQETVMPTNDTPDHPDEVLMGFTVAQIEELRRRVEQDQGLSASISLRFRYD